MKEHDLLDEAMEFLERNPRAALTGSLMLNVRGINKRREAHDIDIIVPDINDLVLPLDWVQVSPVYPDSVKFQVEDAYVDIMVSPEEKVQVVNGIRCASIGGLIQAKLNFYKQNSEASEKHKLDLEFLGFNLDEPTAEQEDELPW